MLVDLSKTTNSEWLKAAGKNNKFVLNGAISVEIIKVLEKIDSTLTLRCEDCSYFTSFDSDGKCVEAYTILFNKINRAKHGD